MMEEQQLEAGNNSDSDATSPGRGSPASQPSDVGGQLASSLPTGAPNSSVVTAAASRGGGIRRRRHRGAADWEIMQGLRSGQRCDDRPNKFEGYLLKRRKWPLKGWHKRFFCLDKGMLTYAKSSTDMAKGKIHGSVDLGLSVLSTKSKGRRIDIDAEEFIYHLKVKSQAQFQQWISQLRHHRLYRQHELAFGSRDAPKMTSPVGDDSSSMAVTGGKAHWWPSSLCSYICDRATSKDTSFGQNRSSFSLDRQSIVHQCYRDLTYDKLSLAGGSWLCVCRSQVPTSQDKSMKEGEASCPGALHTQYHGTESTSTSATDWQNNNLEEIIAGQKGCRGKREDIEMSSDTYESTSEMPISTKALSEPVKANHCEDATQGITLQNQKYTTCGIDTDEDTVLFVRGQGCTADRTKFACPVVMNEADYFSSADAVNRGRTRQMIDFFEQANCGKPLSTAQGKFRRAAHRNCLATLPEGSYVAGTSGGGIEIGIDTSQENDPEVSSCSTQISRSRKSPRSSFVQCCSPVPSFLLCSGSLYRNSYNRGHSLPLPPPLHRCSGQSRTFHTRPVPGCQKFGSTHYNAGLPVNWMNKASKLQLQTSQPTKKHHSGKSLNSRGQSTGFGLETFHKVGNTPGKTSKEPFCSSSEKQGPHCCNVPTFRKTNASRCDGYQEEGYELDMPCFSDLSVHKVCARAGSRDHQPIPACAHHWQGPRNDGGSHFRASDCVGNRNYKSRSLLPVKSTDRAPIDVSEEPLVASRADLFSSGSLLTSSAVSVEVAGHVQDMLDDVLFSESQHPTKNLKKRRAAMPAELDASPKRGHTPRIFLYSRSDCNFIKDPLHFLKVNKDKIRNHHSCSEGCQI